MALEWNNIVFTTWFHVADHLPPRPTEKEIDFWDSQGHDVQNLGSANTKETSRAIIFAPGGGNHQNAFYESTAAAIEVIIANIETAWRASTLATLEIDSVNYTNMKLDDFRRLGPVRPVVTGGTTKYIQEFVAVFLQYEQ